jgi:hypothetical protein
MTQRDGTPLVLAAFVRFFVAMSVSMIRAFRGSIRKRALGAAIFVLSGIFLSLIIVTLPLIPLPIRFAWLGHAEKQSLAVILSGASVAGAIIVLLAPDRSSGRHRR